jgi:hypothetical protein
MEQYSLVEPFVHADDDGRAGGGGEGVATDEPRVGEEETGRQRGGGEAQEEGGGGAQTQVHREAFCRKDVWMNQKSILFEIFFKTL